MVDVLSQYYITYYTLLKEADPKVKAASDTEDMIGYLYYAYVMGTYYEQAIAMYQTAGINEAGNSYRTDFGTVLTQTSIDNTVETLWTTASRPWAASCGISSRIISPAHPCRWSISSTTARF